MKRKIIRLVALLCCIAMLATGSVTVASANTGANNGFSLASLFDISGLIDRIFFQPIRSILWGNPAGVDNSEFRMLSYRIDGNGVFYTESDPWQKQFGFNEIFDMATPFIQLVYGTVRIRFQYDYVFALDANGNVRRDRNNRPIYATDSRGNRIPKDWMVQMWKGRYGLVLLGGEIGLYTKPSTQRALVYECALPEEEIVMAIDVYQHNFRTGSSTYLFTRGPHKTWWITGFVPGSFHNNRDNNRGRSEIIMVTHADFPSRTMLNLFIGGLEQAGFRRGAPGPNNPETFVTVNNSVKWAWQFIDDDA